MSKGVILKGIASFYYVDTEDEIIECKARGKFRLVGKPLVGDHVEIEKLPEGTGFITSILDRKNELIRPASANLDQIVIVASEAAPITDTFLIDKIISIAENKGIDVIICINKVDVNIADSLYNIYDNTGYKVLRTSAKTGEGIEDLKSFLDNKITVFTGNSGVGKSSILNQINSDFNAKTGDISKKIGRGKNTTRHAELFKISENSYICDTPGFSSFDTAQVDLVYKNNLQHTFKEFEEYIPNCRFTGCSHTKEKDCAVIDAVNNNEIQQSRYNSYLKMYEEVKDIKEWQMKEQR